MLGKITSAGAAPFPGDAFCNVATTPTTMGGSNGTTGAMDQAVDPDPAAGEITYYIVSRNQPGGASVDALGCANPAGLSLSLPAPFFGCPPPGDPDRLVRRTAGALCP